VTGQRRAPAIVNGKRNPIRGRERLPEDRTERQHTSGYHAAKGHAN
jgi:hypothetical protein